MSVVLIGRDVLKILGIDPVTKIEKRRAAGEQREITCPYVSFKSKQEERSAEIDNEVPIAEEWSEVKPDAGWTEMIPHGAK